MREEEWKTKNMKENSERGMKYKKGKVNGQSGEEEGKRFLSLKRARIREVLNTNGKGENKKTKGNMKRC